MGLSHCEGVSSCTSLPQGMEENIVSKALTNYFGTGKPS